MSVKNTKDNESTNNEKKPKNKPDDERIEKKIHSKKVDNKGRKILGKSLQSHSPIYE